MINLTFGEKIKEARKLKEFTQKQLAIKIGAKHNSVSDWENNKNKPDPDTIELLCGVLDISPNYLLTAETDDFSPAEKSLIKKYRDIDNYGKETVNFILDRETERSKTIRSLTEKSSYVTYGDMEDIWRDTPSDPEELERMCPPLNPDDIKKRIG